MGAQRGEAVVESGTGCGLLNPHIFTECPPRVRHIRGAKDRADKTHMSALEGLRAREGKNQVSQAITEGVRHARAL